MSIDCAYDQGFIRVAAVTVPVSLADPATNAARHIQEIRRCATEGADLIVFPELSLTGYSLDDIVLQAPLLKAALAALAEIAQATIDLIPLVVVGLPLVKQNRVYNCAAVLHRGAVLGIIPKSNLPTYREFYERRWYAPGDDQRGQAISLPSAPVPATSSASGGLAGSTSPDETIPAAQVLGQDVPFGPDLLFDIAEIDGCTLHVEICEDMWVPIPPSAEAALAGASVLANLSGSPITIGKAEDRKLLARSASSRCAAAYVFAAAGEGESSTDLAWDGQTFVYENGDLLGETERFPTGPRATVVDVDVERLLAERLRQGTFDDNRRTHAQRTAEYRRIQVHLRDPQSANRRPLARGSQLRRPVARFPFVPQDADRLAQDCYEAFQIQVAGLVQRLRSIGGDRDGGSRPVIGLSGGLDSTHALLVILRAMKVLGRPARDVLAFTMPGFATSDHTRTNAQRLAEATGVTFETIDIRPAATRMLEEMGHPFGRGKPVYDVTFENVQAGLRYDYLFRLANQRGGIVVGTGDLSELALGWCTYGVGDHMSHYTVNSGVPKTLIQHLIRWVIDTGDLGTDTVDVLDSILGTEISPELIPAGESGQVQSTEDTIGPYALHDFALYYLLRRGYGPRKTALLAEAAWSDQMRGSWPPGYRDADRRAYTREEIDHWLEVFCRRFVSQQFKRSAIPNGPKVLAGGSLSPRGDWRMPSDARARIWLDEIAAMRAAQQSVA
ncbi:NAD(+) synthase [Devriesea agamarum]|uniref:NAD(+) synthase n=1 Tax=Devriesea agamarum TaxID=472569 RepID=UPI00071CA3B4|nr:NAD(+) synthase [Devriesea agamarum]